MIHRLRCAVSTRVAPAFLAASLSLLAFAGLATPARADVITGPVLYEDSAYYVVTAQSWDSAGAEAVAMGGHLVAINDAAENAFVASTFRGGVNCSDACWIGFNDIASERSFVWSNGDPVTYTAWYPGEPNDSQGEDCTILHTGVSQWIDYTCEFEFKAIVEVASCPANDCDDTRSVPTLYEVSLVLLAALLALIGIVHLTRQRHGFWG